MKKIALILLVAGFTPFIIACSDQGSGTENGENLSTEAGIMASETAGTAQSNLVSNMKSEEKQEGSEDGNNPVVVLETSKGNIEIELNPTAAPVSSKNFLDYVDSGFYNGLIFHRVINNFMIQGGGFDNSMQQKKTGAEIVNEAGNGLTNDMYTVAMARTNVINSATSQFFINVKNNDFLNHRDESMQGFGYAVFGKVVAGMDVVDQIKAVPTGITAGFQDVPVTPVVIVKAYRK